MVSNRSEAGERSIAVSRMDFSLSCFGKHNGRDGRSVMLLLSSSATEGLSRCVLLWKDGSRERVPGWFMHSGYAG